MKITVMECLQLDIFKDAQVIAGNRNLDNKVKAISVLEATEKEEISEFVDGEGQMLLTGFLGIRDSAEKQIEAIKELSAKNVSVVVLFHVGKAVKELDKRVIDVAEALGLPMVLMDKDAPGDYGNIINIVMGKILYGDHFSNNLISNTIFHLLDFEKHNSFQDAIKTAAISNGFQLILLSDDFNPILSIETRHKASIADAIRAGKEREIGKTEGDASVVYTMVDVNGVLTYWGPVMIDGSKYFMFIVDNDDSYTPGEITKLAEIIELAMGMWKYTPERDAKSEFIKAMKRGNSSLARTLIEEAGIEEDKVVSVFSAKGIENLQCTKILSSSEEQEGVEILKISDDDETYGMIVDMRDDDDPKARCLEIYNKLKEVEGVKIFHVTGLLGIEGIKDAYKLIGESWHFVQNVFPYKRVFTKYELTLVSNCINIQLQGGFVKKNYMELLESFKSIGGNKGRQLLDTLETFILDAGMNSGKTAQFMDIHPNTVQYRLKKINEILGAEITGNRVIPGLTIALALKRIERVVV